MCGGNSHSKATGSDIHVGSLQEYTDYKVRGRAHNIRGTSEWSKPIRVLTRRKAVDGGCDNGLYKWTQTRGELVIQLAVGVQTCPVEYPYRLSVIHRAHTSTYSHQASWRH